MLSHSRRSRSVCSPVPTRGRARPSVCRSSCKRMWLRAAATAVRRGFPHRDVRGGLWHTTFETVRGSLSRRSAQQCRKSRQAGAQQMHSRTPRRPGAPARGAHTVCRKSSLAGGTPPTPLRPSPNIYKTFFNTVFNLYQQPFWASEAWNQPRCREREDSEREASVHAVRG